MKNSTIHIRECAAIGPGCSPYVISEIGTNHNRSLETARELVRQAAEARCNCVKFQIYEPEEIVSPQVRIGDYGLESIYGNLNAQEVFEHHLKTPKTWFPQLRNMCHDLGLDCMVTIHGEDGLVWAKDMGVDAVKLASMDHTNLPLMELMVGAIDAPILVSFGMATLAEIDVAIDILRDHPAGIALFYCVAAYPARPSEVSLGNIPFLRKRYGLEVGFSDHTADVVTGMAAVGLGASMFEKHLTLDRTQDGPDHHFALEPIDLATYVSNIRSTFSGINNNQFIEPSDRELNNRSLYLKSIILRNDLVAGHKLTKHDVYLARPGTGLNPGQLKKVIGQVLVRDVIAGSPLKIEDVDSFRNLD
jgi:sialic acid synthase SpsE